MRKQTPKQQYLGIGLLLLTTLIWGSAFPLLKETMTSVSPSVLNALRFVIGAFALLPTLRYAKRSMLKDGVVLGSLYFIAASLAMIGLQTISASRSAFLISLNVVLVPLLSLFQGNHLPTWTFITAGLAFSGIGIMSWQGGGVGIGDFLTLLSAVCTALYVIQVEAAAKRHPILPLSGIQLIVMAILGLVCAAPELSGQTDAIRSHLGTILYIGLIVTATTVLTQIIGQRWISAPEAALLYTLEPVFAALFAFWLLKEYSSSREIIGAGLVLAATVLKIAPLVDRTQYYRFRSWN